MSDNKTVNVNEDDLFSFFEIILVENEIQSNLYPLKVYTDVTSSSSRGKYSNNKIIFALRLNFYD